MNELAIDMKKKYPTFDITPQHLGQEKDTSIFQTPLPQ